MCQKYSSSVFSRLLTSPHLRFIASVGWVSRGVSPNVILLFLRVGWTRVAWQIHGLSIFPSSYTHYIHFTSYLISLAMKKNNENDKIQDILFFFYVVSLSTIFPISPISNTKRRYDDDEQSIKNIYNLITIKSLENWSLSWQSPTFDSKHDVI